MSLTGTTDEAGTANLSWAHAFIPVVNEGCVVFFVVLYILTIVCIVDN